MKATGRRAPLAGKAHYKNGSISGNMEIYRTFEEDYVSAIPLLSSLRVRLVVLLLAALLLSAVITLYTSTEHQGREARRVEAEAQTLLQLIAAHHGQFIEGTRQLLMTLAEVPEVRGAPEACAAVLHDLFTQAPPYSDFTVADADGNLFCSARPVSEPMNFVEEAWFQRARQTRAFAVGDYQTEAVRGAPALVFAYPLLDAGGDVLGILSASIDLSAPNGLSASGISLPEDAVVAVFDRQGVILAYESDSDSSRVGQAARDTPLVETIITQGAGAAEVRGVDGVARLYAFTSLQGATDYGLYAAVGIPRASALAETGRLFAGSLIALGLAGAGALALAWWSSGALLLRPIKALVGAAEQVRHGNLHARTGLSDGKDEIAQLGLAFDAMAAALEQREAERRDAEAQLQESEYRYRRLVELSPDAILVRTGDEITFINPAGARLLGAIHPDQLIGRPIGEFIHPDWRGLAHERIRPAETSPLVSHAEMRFLRLDGNTFEGEMSASPLTYEGQPAIQVVIRDVTERKRMEAALRESEERFRTMADNAPVLIWVAGSDAMRTFFNKPWLDFTGRIMEMEAGAGWTDGVHPDDYQRCLDAYLAAFKARQRFELEYRLQRADGAYRWMVDIGVPRFAPDGSFAGYIGSGLDITERRRAEEALRLSRDQFAIILQGAADGITAQDPAGRLRYANDAAARMFGYPSAEALLAVSLPEVMQKFEAFDEAGGLFPLEYLPGQLALRGAPKASAKVRLRPLSAGDERWLAIKATPVFNEQGQVELAVNIFQDITDLKQAGVSQRLLAEAGQLLAASLDEAARLVNVTQLAVPLLADWCAMDIVDEDGTVRRIAVAHTDAAGTRMIKGHPFDLEAISGASRAGWPGEPEFYPFVPDSLLEAAARDAEHLRALRALDLKSAMVVPLIARGQPIGALTFVWVESRRRYSRTDLALAEELARRVALALDNTRLYNEAQKLNATLEQRVSTRTAQLLASNARLEASQTQLRLLSAHLQQAREEERIRIAREIHDELGQALAGLKMDVAWLQRTLDRQAASVAPKLEDMSRLIDTTVQMVRRISAELRPSLLDDLGLAAAMEWQLDEFRERTGLECVFHSNLEDSALNADSATAVFRIFQETLTNVARHAQATRVVVALEESLETLTLRVQDNGRGITEADIGKAKSFGLLGMRERVHLLVGEIDIQSVPGQGTTITIRIPLQRETTP